MTEEEARPLIDQAMDHYITLFRLGHWHFMWKFDRLETLDNDNVVRGDVVIHSDRWRAEIRFDLDHVEDETALVDCVRHELLHVLTWPFDQLSGFAKTVIPSEYENAFGHVHTASAERLVGNLELFLDFGLALTPSKTLEFFSEGSDTTQSIE